MSGHPLVPRLGDKAPADLLAKAVQATLASAQTLTEDQDAERRHARHDERERDRALSRERHQRLYPFDWWPYADKADLYYEISRRPPASVSGRRRKLTPVTVDALGSCRPVIGPRENPFAAIDGWGRPLLNQVCTTGLSTSQAAAAYQRVLRGNAIGLVFSTHVTITWPLVGVLSDGAAHEGQRKVFAVLRDLNRRNIAQGRRPLAWLWTLERSEAKGLHSHVILACDPQRRGVLLRAVARAVRDYTGRTAAEVSAMEIPAQSHGSAVASKPDYAIAMTSPPKKLDGSASLSREMRAQWALWRYIFKGVETSYWDGKNWMFRSLARTPQGVIQGQRWGYSTASLGDAAWKRYALSVGGDPECVARYVDRLWAIEYPEGIDVHSPIWSA